MEGPSMSRRIRTLSAALAVAAGVLVVAEAAPARAGDDPYAPIRPRYQRVCINVPGSTVTRRVCTQNGVCHMVTTTSAPRRECGYERR